MPSKGHMIAWTGLQMYALRSIVQHCTPSQFANRLVFYDVPTWKSFYETEFCYRSTTTSEYYRNEIPSRLYS